jgi:hypothetical protein
LQHVIQGCHLNCCPACMYLLPLYAWETRSRTHRLKSACLPASGGTWNIICQHRATCVAVSLQTKCLLWESLPNINKARGGRRAEGSGRGCLSIVMRPPPQMVSELDASSRLRIWQHALASIARIGHQCGRTTHQTSWKYDSCESGSTHWPALQELGIYLEI